MQVFNYFLKIFKKHIKSVLVYTIAFLGISIAFASTGQSNEISNFEDTKLDIAVIDRDNSEISNAIEGYMGNIHNLIKVEDEKSVLQDELFFRQVEYILVIPEGFGDAFAAGEDISLENIKVPGSYSGYFADAKVDNYMKVLSIYLASGESTAEAIKDADSSVKIDTTVSMTNKLGDTFTSTFYYYRFLPYILLSGMIVGLGGILISFQNKEVSRRMECSSMSPIKRNLQIIAGSFVVSLVYWGILMVLGLNFYQDTLEMGQIIILCLNSFLFLLFALGVSFLISILVKNSDALSAICNSLGLGMSFLGGVFVPLELLGKDVLKVSRFLPTYWYEEINQWTADALETGNYFSDKIRNALGLELLFALAVFAIALVVTKQKRQSN